MTTSMLRAARTTSSQTADGWRLTRRFQRQLSSRTVPEHECLCPIYAITFRPGDRTGNFLNKPLLPIGQSVLVALSYNETEEGRRAMPITGFRAKLASEGVVDYGVNQPSRFDYDAILRPQPNSTGRRLNPHRNPSLFELMLRMDNSCQRQVERGRCLPTVPQFPRILLGFAPTEVPAFEDSLALRRLAARKMNVPIERLGANGPELLDRLLHNFWDEQLRWPDVAGNDTGLVLVDAELCGSTRKSLRAFEDFSGLMGSYTWNPARAVTPLEVPNPASEVLAEFGFHGQRHLAESATQEQVDALELAVRRRLGDQAELFTVEEIYDGLLFPTEPLVARNHALPKLRAQLDHSISECATDQDILTAAQSPDEPLYASGLCRIQVLRRRRGLHNDALKFASQDLGRRIEADLRDERSYRLGTSVSSDSPDLLMA